MRKITGVLIDVKEGTAKKTTIEKSLDGYYKALDCDCIDIAAREIGGKMFDIILDDEGLLKNDPIMSGVQNGHPCFVGNLFIVKYNGRGDVTSLSDDESELVLSNIHKAIVVRNGKIQISTVVEVDL